MSCARSFSMLLFTNISLYSNKLGNIRRAEISSAFALLVSLIIEFMNIFKKSVSILTPVFYLLSPHRFSCVYH